MATNCSATVTAVAPAAADGTYTTADYKVFKDPVLDQIPLHSLLVKIIDTQQFQRLRDILQLSTVYYVYHGASHNRFEHSIGVCHLAKQLLEKLRQKQQYFFKELKVTAKDEMCVLIAALCHELGQGPMSHLYQDLFIPATVDRDPLTPSWKHVEASVKMFDYLIEENAGLRVQLEQFGIDSTDMIFIKELMYGGPLPGSETLRGRPLPQHRFLYEIVSNKQSGVDVDKMDYIARDCHQLGIPQKFDWQRFIHFAMLIKDPKGIVHICPRDKEAADLYELFQIRDKLFRVAYQHKTKRAIEHMMAEALKEADSHILLGERRVRMSEAINDMQAFTLLTDGIFWYIRFSRDENLKKARDLLERVERRELYQCIGRTLPNEKKMLQTFKDIPEQVIHELNRQQTDIAPSDILVDTVTFNYGKEGKNPIDEVWFYKKDETDQLKAVKIYREQVSEMLPKIFQEFEIRVYVKKYVDQVLKQELCSAFVRYCKANGLQTPAGANGSKATPSPT